VIVGSSGVRLDLLTFDYEEARRNRSSRKRDRGSHLQMSLVPQVGGRGKENGGQACIHAFSKVNLTFWGRTKLTD